MTVLGCFLKIGIFVVCSLKTCKIQLFKFSSFSTKICLLKFWTFLAKTINWIRTLKYSIRLYVSFYNYHSRIQCRKFHSIILKYFWLKQLKVSSKYPLILYQVIRRIQNPCVFFQMDAFICIRTHRTQERTGWSRTSSSANLNWQTIRAVIQDS